MSDHQSDLDWAREIGAADQVIRDLERHLRRRRRRRVAVAVALVVTFSAAVWNWRGARSRPASPAPLLAVASSDPRIVAPEQRHLEDGSTVALRPGAAIAVDYRPDVRRVNLLGGEGLFKVAKNVQRPFLVDAAGVEVRAVGTAFVVQIAPRRGAAGDGSDLEIASTVEVLVTEGRVAVRRGNSGQPTFVNAGERVLVPTRSDAGLAPVARVPSGELHDDLEWTVPRLRLDGTPLAEAVALFNRYGSGRIDLAEPALGELRLSGMLRADDREALFSLLQGEFHLTAERRGAAVLIRRP